jgi:poly(3-hydroxybutyrate) depolymerase
MRVLSRSLKSASFQFAIAAHLSLPFATPAAAQLAATPPLEAYGVDIQQTSVSGASSGAAMAVQMHVAHSSIMRGIGVIAGVAYDCVDSRLPTVLLRLTRGLACMNGGVLFGAAAGAAFSIDRTDDAAQVAGAIDNPSVYLPRQKVWLFSGYNDGSVRRGAMDALALYYDHYINPGNVKSGNVFYQTDNHAPHAIVTDDHGGPCLGFNDEWINNCNYDAAGRLLKHIYGNLNPRAGAPTGSILEFDQSRYTGGMNPASIGLADTGFVYVPTACLSQDPKEKPCRVHVVFHGCRQYAGNPKVGKAVVQHAGYNRWADTNKLIVLYPQTTATDPSGFNPAGCWDWWGLTDALKLNAEFARKTGYQISTIKAMLDRLAENFVAGAGPLDPFGAPQDLHVADQTSTSVALVWRPNTAAAGFNIYRSPAGAGSYTKVNGNPVLGASFADRGLAHGTAYDYEIRAIDGSSQESAPTKVMGVATAPARPACDPYFSSNQVHVDLFRAVPNLSLTRALALGSLDDMGPLTLDDYSHLIKDPSIPFYNVGYCP